MRSRSKLLILGGAAYCARLGFLGIFGPRKDASANEDNSKTGPECEELSEGAHTKVNRARKYLELENFLNFLRSTTNISLETGIYKFNILKKTFFSSLADDRMRFWVLQRLELLLGLPLGTTLFIEKGLPFLKSAINAVYEEKDGESATILLRIVYSLKDHAPELLALAIPLLLLLPDKLDLKNLKTVMHFSQHIIEYFRPNDWKKILCWCFPFIGYESTKGFANILGVSEKDLDVDIAKMNHEALEVNIESKEIIVPLLHDLVVIWLKQGNKGKQVKKVKSKL